MKAGITIYGFLGKMFHNVNKYKGPEARIYLVCLKTHPCSGEMLSQDPFQYFLFSQKRFLSFNYYLFTLCG